MNNEKEPDIVNILIIRSIIESFDSSLVCIDAVFLNEIDIWNYIEKKYYEMIKTKIYDIEKVKIDRWGVHVFLKTNNEKFSSLNYEIFKRAVL